MNKKYIVNNLVEGQGLGNQLWCIFTTIGISEKFKDTLPLIGNWKLFKGNELLRFINVDVNSDIIKSEKKINLIPRFDLLTAHDFSKFDFSKLKIYLNNFNFVEILGHLQFSEYLPKNISKYFILLFDSFKQEKTCVIHVRGGDFLKTATWAGKSYYEPALKEAKIPENYPLNVICDDNNFAKKLFPKSIIAKNSRSVSDNKRSSHHLGEGIVDDFKMIYRAKINVIPSSTFSFWPAYLSKVKFGNEKDVYAPKNWFSHRFPNIGCSPADYSSLPFVFIKPIQKKFIVLPSIKTKYRLPPKLYRAIYIITSLNYK